MSTTEPSPPPAAAPAKRKRKGARAYLVLALLAGGVVGAYLIHGYLTRDQVSTDDAQVDADVVPVAARVTGVVRDVLVDDNQAVTAGQPLLALDPADFDAKVAAATADLDAAKAQAEAADAQVEIVKSTSSGGLSSARAQLQGTSVSVRAAAAQVQAASAALARARTELTKTEADLARATRLHDQGAVTGQALEGAQAARDGAAAAVDLATANLTAARDQQQLSQTRVAEAQGRVAQSAPIDQQIAAATASAKLAHARVASAEAALRLAELSRGYATITAPIDGFVSKLAVHAGQMIQPGAMLAMVVPRTTYVIANFKETQIARIHPGDTVDVDVDAAGSLRGIVDSVAPATGARFSMFPPDNATGNFVKVVQRVPVKIVWAANQDTSRLRAGLSAEVTVHLRGGGK